MDFTLKRYAQLLQTLKKNGYTFLTFEQFIQNKTTQRCVILRHDIDHIPANALQLAKIEADLGIQSSYYIRVISKVWNENVVNKLIQLGHEVSYHYEDLTITKGNYEEAIRHFEFWLKKIRNFYPAKTICMHGSPLSRWDNRKLWEKYKYQEYGIIAEPYFDVDYEKVFYITDTGRAWNKTQVSVRDFVKSDFNFKIKSTKHLLNLIENDSLPNQIMINTHPHRWFNFGPSWIKEYFLQNAKNVVKWLLIKWKNK